MDIFKCFWAPNFWDCFFASKTYTDAKTKFWNSIYACMVAFVPWACFKLGEWSGQSYTPPPIPILSATPVTVEKSTPPPVATSEEDEESLRRMQKKWQAELDELNQLLKPLEAKRTILVNQIQLIGQAIENIKTMRDLVNAQLSTGGGVGKNDNERP